MYICMYVCMYVCICVSMHVCMYVCMCFYIHFLDILHLGLLLLGVSCYISVMTLSVVIASFDYCIICCDTRELILVTTVTHLSLPNLPIFAYACE